MQVNNRNTLTLWKYANCCNDMTLIQKILLSESTGNWQQYSYNPLLSDYAAKYENLTKVKLCCEYSMTCCWKVFWWFRLQSKSYSVPSITLIVSYVSEILNQSNFQVNDTRGYCKGKPDPCSSCCMASHTSAKSHCCWRWRSFKSFNLLSSELTLICTLW